MVGELLETDPSAVLGYVSGVHVCVYLGKVCAFEAAVGLESEHGPDAVDCLV